MALNRLKACGGLQPVPEESAANGTTAGAQPDAAAGAPPLPVNPLDQKRAKNADGPNTNSASAIADRRLRQWCSEDTSAERPPPEDVSEKEYRIWFPRTEVTDEDSANRASGDWRTFREYRYTECSRAGRLEKTLSVDEVYKGKDPPCTLAAAVPPPTMAFHCVSCSKKDEDNGDSLDASEEGRCKMLFSTKSELFREHRGRLLSRLIDDSPSPCEPSPLKTDMKPKLSQDLGTEDNGCREKEARTSSVCQTSYKEVAFEDDEFAKKNSSSDTLSSSERGPSSAAPSRSLSDKEGKNDIAVSAGVQDASLVSVDDDFDDSKCTYMKVESVDSEVEDEVDEEGMETVIGAPSPEELGNIAEEPEDEVDEAGEASGNQKPSSVAMHEATEAESSRTMSGVTESRQQELLSSKADATKASEAGEKENGSKINGSTLETAAHLVADVNELERKKSLTCHSQDSKESLLEEQNEGRVTYERKEQKDTAEAAPRHDDFSDAETNESDTKSGESVISVKAEAIILPNTNDRSPHDVLEDTAAASANVKESSLDSGERFGSSDRLNKGLLSGENLAESASDEAAKSQEMREEDKEDILLRTDTKEVLQGASKVASLLNSEYTSSSYASHYESRSTESKSELLTHKRHLKETEHFHKQLTESLDDAAHKIEHVIGEANLSRLEELRTLEANQALTKDAASHIFDTTEHIEEIRDASSKYVVSSVTSEHAVYQEEEDNSEVCKQSACTVGECLQNDPEESLNERPKRLTDLSEPQEVEFSQQLKTGTLAEEACEFESVDRISNVDEVTEKTRQSVSFITDDSLFSKDASSDKNVSVEHEGQLEHPNVLQGVKDSVKNILQIEEGLKQDAYRSAEVRSLTNIEVTTRNILTYFAEDEERMKLTSETASSILNGSLPKNKTVDDDVMRDTGNVRQRYEHLAETEIKKLGEDVVEELDDLALNSSREFQADDVFILDNAEMLKEIANKTEDCYVVVEKGCLTDNKETLPTILPDEHHLLKEPQISSIVGQEGEGTGLMSTVVNILHEENSLSSSIKASMLKDVIALNRTDDTTSVDDASLQDDNDQGFESLPCDQALDSEDSHDGQVRDESGDVGNVLPVDNGGNGSAVELSALLDELVGQDKDTSVSSQHETATQTSSTEATYHKNETIAEPQVHSTTSNGVAEEDGSTQKGVQKIERDENVHPMPAVSPDVQEHQEVKRQASATISRGSDSAVTDERKITVIAGRNREGEDVSDISIEESTSKTSDPHSTDASVSQQSAHEEEQATSRHNEKSEEPASEHSVNQKTLDEEVVNMNDVSVNESQDVSVPTEFLKEGSGQLCVEKHADHRSNHEISEVKQETLREESRVVSVQSESTVRYEASEALLTKESINRSTRDSEIVIAEVDPSETKLRDIVMPEEANERNDTTEHFENGRTTYTSSNEIHVAEQEPAVDRISELTSTVASVPNESSKESDSEGSAGQNTNYEIVAVKAETPVDETSETRMSCAADTQGKTFENSPIQEPVCQSAENEGVTTADEEASIELVPSDLNTQGENGDETANENTLTHIAAGQYVTNVKEAVSRNEFPEIDVSNELAALRKTSDVTAREEPGNHGSVDMSAAEVKAEISSGEVPGIVVSTEESKPNENSEVPVKEATSKDTECTNVDIAKVEPHIGVCELTEMASSSELSGQSKTPDVVASEESLNHDNGITEATKVDAEVSVAEVLDTVASTEAIGRNIMPGQSASEMPLNENADENTTSAELSTFVRELVCDGSSELSGQSKTSDELASEGLVTGSIDNHDVSTVNTETPVSEPPEIVVSYEAYVRSTSEEPASEGTPRSGASHIEVIEETLFNAVPETVVSVELSKPSGTSEEPMNEAPMNHNGAEGELDRIDSDESANELLKSTAFNESSPQSEASNIPVSEEARYQVEYDHLNTSLKNDTSVSKLPEIVTYNETTIRGKSSGELVSEEAAQQAVTYGITEIKGETRTSQFPDIAIPAETSLQNTYEKLEYEETTKRSTSVDASTVVRAETSNELPDVRVFSEAKVEDEMTEDSTSEEGVNRSTSIEQTAKVDAETPESESTGIVACNEMNALSNATENSSTEKTVLEGVSDGDNTAVDGETSNILPEIAAPDEANVQIKTSAKFEKDVVEDEDLSNIKMTEAKAGTITSELSDILPPHEDSVPNVTSQASTSRENPHETGGNVEILKIMDDVPTSDVPEYPMYSEPALGSKSTEELKSDAAVNGITDSDFSDVKSDASIEEMSDVTALNEKSVNEATEEATTSKGNAHQSSIDNGNAEMKIEMSVSSLPEITESDRVNMQAAEELASQHPVTQNASDNYATDTTPGTSINEPLENSESIKCPECEEFGNALSETSEVSLENATKGGTSEDIVVDVISEHGQPKAVCVERTGSQTKLAKRFANADSYDELTEDNETGSTSADSGDGEQLGTTRLVKSREGGRIEMVDKVPEGDVIRSSSEDITKGCIEIHAPGDTHALNEERRRSQEESVRQSTEERFAKQESVDDHVVDAKTTTRGRSTSDGSTLEEVSAGFSGATEDDQTAVIEKGSEGVSNTALEETAGGTSGAPSKEGDAHTSEPAKRSSEGTDGGDATWGRSATEEIANVTDGREGRVELTDGRLESDKEEVLDTEISTFQDFVDATEPVTTEAYNADALGTLVNSPLQQETKDDRSSLLEYAEEIVSTVLTRCVTYLEENNQEWRKEKQAGRNHCDLDADTDSAAKEEAIKNTRDDEEKLGVPLPHSDCTNRGSYNGDVFEPIFFLRQSSLEEVASFSDHQNAVTRRDSTQVVLVGPVSIEKEEDPSGVLSSMPNEKQDESVNTGQAGETTANSETAENAETNAPVNNEENVVISQITEEQRDGDAVDNTASISEVSIEDASSSKADTNSSLSASKRDHEFPGQTVVQSDQSEDKQHEEQSEVARQLDAATRDISESASEARQNFVVVENDSQRVECAHTVVAEEVIIGKESQLREKSFTESSCSAGEGGFEHSASDKDARRADDRENTDAENETAVNSFSESSATTVSINTANSEEGVSEHSTRVSKQESDVVQATEVTKDNPVDSADEVHENIPNSESKETRSPNAQHTVVDSKDDAEWREKSTFWPRNFLKSSRQSDIPHNALHGHQGWEVSEGANATVVPDSHDTSGQDMHPEAVMSDEENNQTNAFCTNVDHTSQDKDISKPEGSAAVDNDMNSLGALSTVYESSLEYIRSYTDERISASDVTATLIGDFSAVGKTTTSHQQQLPFKDSTAFGGVFQTDEHSDEEKAEEDSKESVGTTSDIGAENESTQDVLKTKSDTEVAPGIVSDETSGAVCKPVDTNCSLAGLTDMHPQEERKTIVPQVLDDPTTMPETSEDNIAAMKDTGVVLRSQEKLEERQESPQKKSCQNITDDTSTGNKLCGLRAKSLDEEYRKRQEKEQRGLQARSFDEENLKRHDTLSRGITTADEVPSGVFETKIRDTHAVLQEGEQPLEQDEVATMDFSDEEERSLEIEMGAREQIVSVDVHEVPNVRESGSIANGKTATDDAREESVLEKANSAEATTNVNDMECTNRTEEANLTQLDEGIPVQKVEVGTEEHGADTSQDHNENADVAGPSEKLPQTIGALKTAVMVHDDTKLEAVECSEDLLQSVATEADFSSDIYEHVGDELAVDAGTNETSDERETGLPAASGVSSTHGDQRASSEECKGIEQVEASNEAKQRDQDGEPHRRSLSDALEDFIVPEHIQSPSSKSSAESEAASEEQVIVANGDLKCAVEDFSRLISSDAGDVQASKKSEEKRRTRPPAVIAESSNENAASEVSEGEDNDKNRLPNASDAKEDSKMDKDNQEDSLKTDSSESFDVSAAGEDIDSGSRNVKENTTRKVTEAVEQSERTEGGIPGSGDPVKSTRIFQRTVKRTESTRTVRRTRSFLPYTKWLRGEKHQRARQETRDEDDVTEPVEEVIVAPQQAFPAMSIPRVGLCPTPDCSPGSVCSVAVQAFPSVVDQGVQVEFDEPDCITRLVELQIAMNEQEEVRRQDMKAACELVEKLEAMQLSESLMRTQLRAMDAERREQSSREARLRDELTAWQETVQQQQLLLQQLKEDLDDTEDTLAAQRQEANRLREQMLVLQESCDSGLLMVDVLGRADKEVQTPDGGQPSLSSSSPYKGIRLDNPSPVYLDQLSQHRRLSALVSSQLEATANRIAQLRREAAANRPRGSTIDEYVQELAVRTDVIQCPDASPSKNDSAV